ncbi:hypothetical protein E2C01_021869 [Portunus trituberculatus]|uniref:Uncharacterized protein n=1 Tax=Portunus trituberculatus TaxID=210409 RepID=A0A5B7E4J6_PORTR|nr:hypothetical protein [Portunus trituberculatus]
MLWKNQHGVRKSRDSPSRSSERMHDEGKCCALSQKSTRPDITRAWCEKPPAGVYLWTQIRLGLVLLLLGGWGDILHIFRGSKSILYDNKIQYKVIARHYNKEQAFITHTCVGDSKDLKSLQNKLTREEHVYELAVGRTGAQLLNLDKVGLEAIIDPVQHIMATQVFSRCTCGKYVHCHCCFAVKEDFC